MKEKPVKDRNYVLKHSVNKSGAGRHANSSKKDYQRKDRNNNKVTNHE